MPYLPTAQAWLTQSLLLLEARPATTRITTKYTVAIPSPKSHTSKHTKPDPTTTSTTTTSSETPPAATASEPPSHPDPAHPASAAPTPRAVLVLKTYNPASGVTLKYKTDKAAEVGRLMASLGRAARCMAGLPSEAKGEAVDAEVGDADGVKAEVTPGAANAAPGGEHGAIGAPGAGGVQGGKKGKKKGKK